MAYTLSHFCDHQKTRIKRRLASESFFRGGKYENPDHYIGQLMSLGDDEEWRMEDIAEGEFEYRRGI